LSYARWLSHEIKETLSKASDEGQRLDSSFPSRLFTQEDIVSKEEFNSRYEIIKVKQSSLSKNGLYTADAQSAMNYNKDDAKALKVYLDDTEKKLKVFDELNDKLNLFGGFLSNKGFVNKKIKFSPEKGFIFFTDDEQELEPQNLSSGEQNEIVMLYELLFIAGKDTLILIDEPEISLHVVWQNDFLNDLVKIQKLSGFSTIVATHSPDIIGDRIDSVIDLFDLIKNI
jgi:predicted ATP-binding protein involved in virulence